MWVCGCSVPFDLFIKLLWKHRESPQYTPIPNTKKPPLHAWISECVWVHICMLKMCQLHTNVWLHREDVSHVRITAFLGWYGTGSLAASRGSCCAFELLKRAKRTTATPLPSHGCIPIPLSFLNNKRKSQVWGRWRHLSLWNQPQPLHLQLCASVRNEISELHLRKLLHWWQQSSVTL